MGSPFSRCRHVGRHRHGLNPVASRLLRWLALKGEAFGLRAMLWRLRRSRPCAIFQPVGTRIFRSIIILLLPLTMAAQQAFPPTAPGVCELKILPPGMLLKPEGRGNYFSEANGLFRPLFRYISSHHIAMTTPVEAQIENAAMYFWVAETERSKVPGSEGGVKVVEVPARSVASIGGKGSYSRENFEKARDALRKWLALRQDVEPAGEAYAVYWNGPFTPWFLKRYEVHLPVRTK